MEEQLILKNLSKSFGGNHIFEDINLSINKGEVYGIIGTNGSGKTTIFNLICGIYPPSKGTIIFDGEDITNLKPWEIARKGIGRCFQLVKPFQSMTPLENIRVAHATAGKISTGLDMDIEEIIEFTNLKDKLNVPTSELSLPDKKNVEIARALACKPKIVLFDEVSCGLSGAEIRQRMEMMKELANRGVTIIVIEHIMMFIKEICDRVAVLHAGEVIAQGNPFDIANDPKVINAYIGGRKSS
ncbi:MAG: ABC transporter ATP-binding protein [Clostridia bacterium]